MIESLKHKPSHPDEVPCPYCGGKVIYTSNARIYHGREYGNGKCYVCTKCGVSVGVHSNGDFKTPLGLLATPEMKQLKMQCHKLFDEKWIDTSRSRSRCYARLAKQMEIPKSQCHFGWFNEADLKRAQKILEADK